MKKRFIAAALAFFCLSGCSQSAKLPKGASENEILTLAAVKQDKELVTIHFEYGFGNSSTFESAIEKNFPNVDIIMVHDGATDSTSLLEGNLKNGTECDIILSRVLQNLEEPQDYLFDLSTESFINNYYLTSVETCITPNSGLYYLPGPANLYGIIYDKTALEQNGWSVPTNYSEFVNLIQTIDSSGLTVRGNS